MYNIAVHNDDSPGDQQLLYGVGEKKYVKNMSNSESTYTVSHAIDAMGFGYYQILLSVTVGMAFVADAMEMMILSVLAPALHCHWQITQIQQASLTTVVFVGKSAVSIKDNTRDPSWTF